MVVVWLGARYAVAGRITPGDLIAFYGYSAFLMIPLRTATEFANKLIRGRVGASRVIKVLALEPDHLDPAEPVPAPPAGAVLADARTGLRIEPGHLVALVSDRPDEAAHVADRLGLCAPEIDDEVTLGGVPLPAMDRDAVRSRVVVSDTGAGLFSGPPRSRGSAATSRRYRRALGTASTQDILDALPEGLDTVVAERGRSSPADSASASCWPAPWPPTPRSWSSSSPPRPSTPTPRPASPPACAPTAPAAPRSWPAPAR